MRGSGPSGSPPPDVRGNGIPRRGRLERGRFSSDRRSPGRIGPGHGTRPRFIPARRRVLDVLDEAGATVRISDAGVEVAVTRCVPSRSTRPLPDLVPVLVRLPPGLAASASSGADRLASKESDRANALVREFSSLGSTSMRRKGACSSGRAIRAGTVNSHGDHRIAMALLSPDWPPRARWPSTAPSASASPTLASSKSCAHWRKLHE